MAGTCGNIDGCVQRAERTIVGAEASLELCEECYVDHGDAALAVVEDIP